MDVPMSVLLQVLQSCKQRAVGVARVNWRLEAVAQFAQLGQGNSHLVMFVDHARNWGIQISRHGLACTQRNDGRKEHLLLFKHMAGEFFFQAEEDIKDLNQ
jgi:hypothetical protein